MKITHVRGNAISLAIPLHKRIITLEDGEEKEIKEDFIPSADYPVTIVLQKNNYATRKSYLAVMDNNVAVVHDNKCCLPTGLYSVELYCLDEKGDHLRYMVKDAIEIVDATADAGIEAGVEFNSEIYTLEGATYLYAKGDKGDQGVSVVSIEQVQTSEESGGTNIVRVTLSNGETNDFQIKNGLQIRPTYANETLTF